MAARLLYKLYKLLKASFNHPVPSPYLIIEKNISKFHYRDRSPIADSPPPIKNGCIRMKRKENSKQWKDQCRNTNTFCDMKVL